MSSKLAEIDATTGLEISRMCAEVCRITGVQLCETQQGMVQARLQRRAAQLGLDSLESYMSYFKGNHAGEIEILVSLLTTHHTYFFREAAHFQFLEAAGLKRVLRAASARAQKKLRILSAACSRGHECYTLSMLLAYHLPKLAPDFTYEIVGLDIDPESIAIASNGVYHRDEIKAVPTVYLGDHWTRGTGRISHFVKANDSIKAPCTFATGNLLALRRPHAAEKYDIVFCRNVFIYFTTEQIQSVVASLFGQMHPDALLFVGMSESLLHTVSDLEPEGPSIYSLRIPREELPAPRTETPQTTQADHLLRVLCVDDSPVILRILAKILCQETGFKIVATAANGIEAAAALATHEIDVMTLDIHMPKQDGLTYLRHNFSATHPPVVVLSSVSRDDIDLATNCLKAGAADYIEKPSLADIESRANEISTKLRSAVLTKGGTVHRGVVPIDAAFAAKSVIADPANKLRIILGSATDREKILDAINEISGSQPNTFIVVNVDKAEVSSLAKELSVKSNRSIEIWTGRETVPSHGSFYVCDIESLDHLLATHSERKVAVLVFADVALKALQKVAKLARRNILVEESLKRGDHERIKVLADDVVPAASFVIMSNQFLAERNS